MIYCNYRPKPDITAYELAVLLPGLVRSPGVFGTGFVTFTTSEWDEMPSHVQRHFEKYQGNVEEEAGADHPVLRALGGLPPAPG